MDPQNIYVKVRCSLPKKFFSGVSTALITPFNKGSIDFKSLKKLIKLQLDAGIQGFVVIGSTAEAATLSFDEKNKIIDTVTYEVGGCVPVIVGTGTNNTEESCFLTKKFSKKNIDGFLLVTPYYNKPPQRGLIEHFKKISLQTTKPIILYNVPSRTIIEIQVDPTLTELVKCKNIAGIKEASGNLDTMKKIVSKKFKNFTLLSGDDETFPQAMALGADGVISVVSHIIPNQCLNYKKAEQTIVEVSRAIFIESNPIPVKYALKKTGVIQSHEVRLPLMKLDKKFEKVVDAVLKKIGKI